MPDLERQIAEMIAPQMSGILNEWFDGLIRFEVDSYFTTISINDGTLFRSGGTHTGLTRYYLCAREIAEVEEMLKDYQSVITYYSVDMDSELSTSDSLGLAKYASINLQGCFYGLRINDIPIENFLNADSRHWTAITGTLLHEFTHTVEQYFYGPNHEDYFPNEPREYHTAISEYRRKGLEGLPVTRIYLLNLAIVQGQRSGIAYDLWKIVNR